MSNDSELVVTFAAKGQNNMTYIATRKAVVKHFQFVLHVHVHHYLFREIHTDQKPFAFCSPTWPTMTRPVQPLYCTRLHIVLNSTQAGRSVGPDTKQNIVIIMTTDSLTLFNQTFSYCFSSVAYMYNYVEQRLLDRSQKFLFFLKSIFFGSDKFQISAHVLQK
jgi:hypothetical protein